MEQEMEVTSGVKKNARKFVDTDDMEFPTPSLHRKKVKDMIDDTGTDETSSASASTEDERLQRMSEALRTIIECMGEDVDREGLQSTPMRAAKALCFFTKGYQQTAEDVVGEGVFTEETKSDMVMVRDIEIHSLCEHHMVPFSGKVHIAYIPNGRILGLSKLARIADVYARRLQVQERLTRQIAEAINRLVSPKGVAVVMEASHMCMVMRGVEKSGASTTTSTLLGTFESDKSLRSEFFSIVNKSK